ncbi:MAG: hypothetical protein R3Y62_05080 [Eubacteriales bacterium]
MDTSYMLLFDFISLAAGAYCLFTCFKMHLAGGRLFPNGLLIPKGLKPSDCHDQKAYTAYLFPRLLAFAIALTIYSIISLCDTFLNFMSFWGRQAMIAVCFGIIVYYAVVSTKANRKYWDMSTVGQKPGRRL